MEGNAAPVHFIKVTKESVFSFLGEARQRVVIAKAGIKVQKNANEIKQQPARLQAIVFPNKVVPRQGVISLFVFRLKQPLLASPQSKL
jgi:hypothetical protein